MPQTQPDLDSGLCWRLLLAAVQLLHKRGLTGLRVVPSIAAVGWWRIEITTAANLRSGVNLPARDENAVFRATEGAFPRVGELEVLPSTTVGQVADEILRELGSFTGAGYVNDREYCGWFAGMRRQAEALGSPPSAFDEFHNGWRCGAFDITPPPGWEAAQWSDA